MARLYINPTLCRAIEEYCKENNIDDINAFANRCVRQGLNIAKYGLSPGDNIERENNGIKDFKNEKGTTEKENASTALQRKEETSKDGSSRLDTSRTREEEIKPTEEAKSGVTVRKIQVIKKDKK